MSPVDFKKWLCRPVEFKGQGPLLCIYSNMNKTGLGQDQFNVNRFKHTLNQICKDRLIQTWLSRMCENSLWSNYKQSKTSLNLEPVLTLLEKKHAIIVCKFRT